MTNRWLTNCSFVNWTFDFCNLPWDELAIALLWAALIALALDEMVTTSGVNTEKVGTLLRTSLLFADIGSQVLSLQFKHRIAAMPDVLVLKL